LIVAEYDAGNPQPSHFTQVVWKATTQIGCAVQTCNGIFAGFGVRFLFIDYFGPSKLNEPLCRLPNTTFASTLSKETSLGTLGAFLFLVLAKQIIDGPSSLQCECSSVNIRRCLVVCDCPVFTPLWPLRPTTYSSSGMNIIPVLWPRSVLT
jgi:hypothetical protein